MLKTQLENKLSITEVKRRKDGDKSLN